MARGIVLSINRFGNSRRGLALLEKPLLVDLDGTVLPHSDVLD